MSKRNRNKGQNSVVQQGPGGNLQALSFTASHTEIRALPKAAELEEYRQADPRVYELILADFQKNADHRREMERANANDRATIVRAASRNDLLGIGGSWIFAVMCLGVGAYFVYTGKEVGALLGILGLLPAVIGAFRRRS